MFYKFFRGLKRLSRGEMPHLFVRWIEHFQDLQWQRMMRAPGSSLRIEVGSGVFLELPKNSFIAKVLVKDNFEQAERNLMLRLLKPGDVFVDVGANVGLFTVLAGKRVGPSGRVIAVEPSPKTAHLLRKQVEINRLDNVTIFECGLSNVASQLILSEATDGNDAFNSFAKTCDPNLFNQVQVEVRTFDSLIREIGSDVNPRLIKIDTEGWEPHVLAGAQRLLSQRDSPDLIIEFCESALNTAGSSCTELFDQLKALGYTLNLIHQKTGKLIPVSTPESWVYANLYATKRSG
jgi:FkbM family methyltransferase